MSNERIGDADIIFLPYNYILDSEILKIYDINITDSILIFDEAHNLARAAEECNSFEISERVLDQCESELISIDSELMNSYLDLDSSFTILRLEVLALKNFILNSIFNPLAKIQIDRMPKNQ